MSWIELFSDISDGTFKGYATPGGVFGDEIGFGAYDVYDERIGAIFIYRIFAEFTKPASHLLEARFISDLNPC